MKTYKQVVHDRLDEALITLGNKRPKFNQIIIMAGGAGSGKGFVQSNLLGVEGKTFDVDALKGLALKSNKYKAKVKQEFGYELDKMNLKNPKDVSTLHSIVDELGISDKHQKNMFTAIMASNPERKPNLIFDVTMKNLKKLDSISREVQELGYDKKDIHVIWVINELDTAIQQNMERSRTVSVDILKDTHRGVSYTVSNIIKDGNVRKFMDGDFWFVFNKKFSDSILSFSGEGGSYVKKALYTKIKERGKNMKSLEEIGDEYINKIKAYVPDKSVWEK